jgi:Recombinase zinc beta ribbon domain
MTPETRRRHSDANRWHIYYRCSGRRGIMACNTRPSIRAQEAEAEVWEFVSDYLKNPDRIRKGLVQMIEEERKGRRGDPEQETKAWFAKQAHVDRKRERCQEMAASDLITFAELSARLAELEETRKVAEQELSDLTYRKERISQLEGDKTELLKSIGSVVPERVDAIKGEKRHRIYRQLRLKKVAVGAGGQLEEAQGVFVERACTNEHTS